MLEFKINLQNNTALSDQDPTRCLVKFSGGLRNLKAFFVSPYKLNLALAINMCIVIMVYAGA
jgi:hypothetical protein